MHGVCAARFTPCQCPQKALGVTRVASHSGTDGGSLKWEAGRPSVVVVPEEEPRDGEGLVS